MTPQTAALPGFPVLHCLLEFAQIHVHWIHWGSSLRQSDNLGWSFNFKIFWLYLGSISSCLVLCEHGEQTNIVTILICTDVSLSKSTNSWKDPPHPQTYWGSTHPYAVKPTYWHQLAMNKMKVTQLCPTLWDPMDCSPPGSSVHGILQARVLEWVAVLFSRGSSQPKDWTQSPSLQADSLPAEPPGKSKNTGVGSLSLLQGIFPTQGSNPGLPHYRWILYQLSHKGNPHKLIMLEQS